jgi:hypothetical protein
MPKDGENREEQQYPDHRTEYIQSPQPVGTRKLARRWGIPYRTIREQCTKEGWVAQREQFQGKVRAESEKEAAETLAEAKARWAKEYRMLQAKGLKGLKKHEPRSAAEAARLLDLGIKGEMLQRDVPQGEQIRDVDDIFRAIRRIREERDEKRTTEELNLQESDKRQAS